MPEPSWETANNTDFHGYLKFLDFQAEGLDVHATFEKSRKIHVSVYSVGSKTDVKLGMQYLVVGVSGVGLDLSRRNLVKNTVRPSSEMPADFWAFFEDRCTKKATELGILAPQQTAAFTTATPISAMLKKDVKPGILSTSTWGGKHQPSPQQSNWPALGTKG